MVSKDYISKYKTRLYKIYNNMKQRCGNPKNTFYSYYGGKGISICEEWSDFEIFKMWANNNGYLKDLTIDRINGDLGYSPSNCRWITRKEQSQNLKSNRIVNIDGVSHNIQQWSEILGINKNTLTKRINNGKLGKEFTAPINKRYSMYYPSLVKVNGEELTVIEASIKYNINKHTLRSRIRRGCSGYELIKEVI